MDLPIQYEQSHWTVRKAARLEYIKKQKGLCYYCGAPLDGPCSDRVAKARINKRLFPSNFFSYPVHLHHSHETGLTIGSVHARCNAYLWQYEGE